MDRPEHLIMNWRSVAMASMLLCALVAQLYLWSKGLERRATAWFGLFLLAVAIDTIPMIIGFAGAYDKWPDLTFLPVDFTLVFGPLLYFHARQLMVGAIPPIQFGLLIPGLIYWLYQLWAFTMLGGYRAKWAYNDAFHLPYVVPLAVLVAIALGAWAFIAIGQMRRRYVEWLDANRSDGEEFEPVWIKHFLVLGVAAASIWVAEIIVSIMSDMTYFDSFWWDMAGLFCVMLLSLEALARINQSYPKMHPVDAKSIEEFAEESSAERDWVIEGKRLREMVIENGWHLEASLSLQTLSRRFGMNQAYVSRALNQGLGLSFSSFVNRLRVEHAKVMILRDDINLLDVALSSGFGSKASFNRAFKLHAGLNPTEFRRLNS